jgi:hypothetical protein
MCFFIEDACVMLPSCNATVEHYACALANEIRSCRHEAEEAVMMMDRLLLRLLLECVLHRMMETCCAHPVQLMWFVMGWTMMTPSVCVKRDYTTVPAE